MLTKQDLIPLIKKNNLLTIEVDDRHIALINEIFAVGAVCGVNHAKDTIRWRINGDMWCDFIDANITEQELQNADAEAA